MSSRLTRFQSNTRESRSRIWLGNRMFLFLCWLGKPGWHKNSNCTYNHSEHGEYYLCLKNQLDPTEVWGERWTVLSDMTPQKNPARLVSGRHSGCGRAGIRSLDPRGRKPVSYTLLQFRVKFGGRHLSSSVPAQSAVMDEASGSRKGRCHLRVQEDSDDRFTLTRGRVAWRRGPWEGSSEPDSQLCQALMVWLRCVSLEIIRHQFLTVDQKHLST